MKKKLLIMITLLMLFSLASCTFEKPEDKAAAFLDAVKTDNTEVLKGYVDNKYVNILVNATGDKKTLAAIKKGIFKNLEYSVSAAEKNEDGSVTLKVNVKNLDFSEVMKDYDAESYSYVIDNLYAGKLNRKHLNEKSLKILLKAVKEALKEKKKYSKEVVVTLKENDHNAYDLIVTDKLMDALSGGFISGLK